MFKALCFFVMAQETKEADQDLTRGWVSQVLFQLELVVMAIRSQFSPLQFLI